MPNPYRIVITAEALSNLDEITDYIRRSSPQNAASVRQRLIDAIDSLAQSPGRYKRVGLSRSHQSPVHAMVVQPFIIYYRIQSQSSTVFILQIRRGSRRQPRRFS